MKNKIEQIIRKTYGYWWVDGMAEIAMGLFFGALSGYYYLMVKLPLSDTQSLIMALAEALTNHDSDAIENYFGSLPRGKGSGMYIMK